MSIQVTTEVCATSWHIRKALARLASLGIMSFDTETKGVYSKAERKQATEYLKGKNLPVTGKALALQVEENSGLSFPSLVDVTHFIFGISESHSVILICNDYRTELLIWEWISTYEGLLLIHNSLFDLKLMYSRVKKFPKRYEDTQLIAKTLTNNASVWKSKVGLKDLMGTYYDPTWTLIDEYEPANPKDPKFIRYCGIDGAATFKLWFDIQDYMSGE